MEQQQRRKKKVLVICGGGIFGAIPAHLLGSLPPEYQTLEGVDLLCGCSVGGILAAAYATGRTFQESDTIFRGRVKDCFTKRLLAYVNPLTCPTYSNDAIDSVIHEIVGDLVMAGVRNVYPKLDLVIPALNITDDKYKVFDNIGHDDDLTPLAAIAGYTSAAPSYFSGRDYKGKCMVDGGLIEVAPLLTATTALRAKRGVKFSDMDVLMLGTGQDIDDKPITTKTYNGLTLLGMATDVVVPYSTLGNYTATCFWGEHMGYNSFVYYNPIKTNGKMDEVDQVPHLVKEVDKVADNFCEVYTKWLER